MADLPVVYRVYDDEQTAAQAAQLLVESGFPPQHVYVGVEREGRLRRAYTGFAVRLGVATSIGAAVSCTIGMLLITSAAAGLISMPLGPLTGLSAISASTLSFIPSAIPGMLLGWLVAVVLWRRGAPNFPAQDARRRAFVGVEVGLGGIREENRWLPFSLPVPPPILMRRDDTLCVCAAIGFKSRAPWPILRSRVEQYEQTEPS